MTSGGHGLQITDDYSKQECLVLTPTMISLKQKYFSDLPYPRYQVKRSSGPMMVASCWSLLRNFLKTSLSSSKACPLDTIQDFLCKLGMKPHMHLLIISIFSLNHAIVRPTKIIKDLCKASQA